MNLIFTCGGTAGHINPAIAVANMMKERYPDANILFIGIIHVAARPCILRCFSHPTRRPLITRRAYSPHVAEIITSPP